jgi:hypothetical protein
MPTPAYKPLIFDESDERLLAQWLGEEINRAESNRETLRKTWKDYDRQYESRPLSETKSTPWEGASNLFIGLTQIHTDMVYGRMHRSLFGLDDFWIVRPLTSQFSNNAKPLQYYMNWGVKTELLLKERSKSLLKEVARLGTGIAKFFWLYKRRPKIIYDENGDPQLKEFHVVSDSPYFEHVRLQDFLIPDPHLEIEQQRWVSQELRYTWTNLNLFVLEGIFSREKIDAIYAYFTTNPRQYEVEEEQIKKFNRPEAAIFTILEIWAKIDINNDGIAESVVIWMEKHSRIIIKVIYNPYISSWFPFLPFRYIRRDGWFYGRGIPETLSQVQDALNTTYNQRTDNATAANIVMMAVRSGAVMNLKPGDSIFPGFILFTDNPREDIMSFKLGDVYPSSFTTEQLLLQYAERLSGITDPISAGRLGSGFGTRTPASLGITLMQQSANRIEIGIDDCRDTFTEVGYRYIELCQQFKPNKPFKILGQDGTFVEEIFQFPPGEPRERFALELAVTSQVINRDIERQGTMMLFQLMINVYERMMELGQLLINPQVPSEFKNFSLNIVRDLDKRLKRLQELFDQKDITEFAPILEDMVNVSTQAGIGIRETARAAPRGIGAATGISEEPVSESASGFGGEFLS